MDFYTDCKCLGGKILYRGIEDGRRVNKTITDYQPNLFLESTNADAKFRTLDGKLAEKIPFESIKSARAFIDSYKGVSNFNIYGNTNFQYTYINKLFPTEISFDTNKIVVAYLDIETSTEYGFPDPQTASAPVLAITVLSGDVYAVFGLKDFDPPTPNIKYVQCENEDELLTKFLLYWNKLKPDIISGWNIDGYDIPYLINRYTRLFGEETARKLSPWKWISSRDVQVMGREQKVYNIYGISSLDYMVLYKKPWHKNYSQESYALNAISHIELGERKLSYDEYDGLQDLYEKNPQKYYEYNCKDVALVKRLEDKLKLIDLSIHLAYTSKVNFEDVLSQLRMWDTVIFNHLAKKRIVLPQNTDTIKDFAYAGAHIKDPLIGMHDWVVSFDVASMYPNIIRMLNISPETLKSTYVDVRMETLLDRSFSPGDLVADNSSFAASGYRFDRTKQGFLGEIIETMYSDRKAFKKKQLKAQRELELVNVEIQRRSSTALV